MSDCIVRPFDVIVPGFAEVRYVARSRGQALAKAWRDYQILGETPFRDFMRIARVKKAEVVDFGQEIRVAGGSAYRVGERGQYVAFVRPCSDAIHLAHPADVRPA
jgi:hypothetical protein